MCERHGHKEDAAEASRISPNRLLDALVVATTNARVYESGHPRLAGAIAELHGVLEGLLDATSFGVLELGVADGYAFVNRQPLLGAGLSAQRIITALEKLDSGGMRFRQPLKLSDLTFIARLLARPGPDVTTFKLANEKLEQEGIGNVEFLMEYGSILGDEGGGAGGYAADSFVLDLDDDVEDMRDATLPYRVYQSVVDSLQEFSIHAMSDRVPPLDLVQGSVEELLKSLVHDPKSVLGVCRYEQYDAFTFGHSIRVASLALEFGRHITDNPQVMQRIGAAALLHDVGKVRVPFEILHAPGRLTKEEFAEMRRHSEYGGEILLGIEGIDDSSILAAVGHHAQMEGESASSVDHGIVTRIVKICDVYEALTAVRPYKDSMSPVRAYRIMMSMRGHFDRMLLRKFIEVSGFYPIGTQVLLSNGETARVHAQTEHLLEPIVEIETGTMRSAGKRLDLSDMSARNPVRIEQIILKDQFDPVQN